MNFFFGIQSLNVNSKLTIPCFQNSSNATDRYKIYQLRIISQRWEIKSLIDAESNKDFYKIELILAYLNH